MDTTLGFLALLVLFLVAGYFSIGPRRRIDASWRAASKQLGGVFHPSGFLAPRSLSLRQGDLQARVETYTNHSRGSAETGTWVTVFGPGVFPPGLSLMKGRTSWFGVVGDPDVEVGEEAFDKKLEIEGDPTSTLAILDHETRTRVLLSVITGVTIANDAVKLEILEEIKDGERIVEIVNELMTIANRLRDPGPDTPKRLARNAAEDPIARVRLANLEALQESFPDLELTRTASKDALRDRASSVRLAAARYLGQEGLMELVDLASSDASIDAGIRTEALQLLAERAPREVVLPALDRILDQVEGPWQRTIRIGDQLVEGSWSGLWREAVMTCGKLRHAAALSKLLSKLDKQDPASAKVVLEALGALGDPAFEPALLELFESEDPDTVVAAAGALGRFGTVRAVEVLLRRTQGVLESSAVKRAAGEAIEAIQGRLRGVERGQLGLAEASGAEGQLSVAEGSSGGEVSLERSRQSQGEAEHE